MEPESLHSGLITLYEALANDALYPAAQQLVLFEGNHDVPRLYSVLGRDPAKVRMALAFVLTTRRIPQLYYGTDLLMESPVTRDDGATRRDVPGGWRGDAVNAFTGAGLSDAQYAMQRFLRTLLHWRRHTPVLAHGQLRHYQPQDGVYVYFRYDTRHTVMVVLNKERAAHALDLARFTDLLPAAPLAHDVLNDRAVSLATPLSIPAQDVLILEWPRARAAAAPSSLAQRPLRK
jgi:glycosidase